MHELRVPADTFARCHSLEHLQISASRTGLAASHPIELPCDLMRLDLTHRFDEDAEHPQWPVQASAVLDGAAACTAVRSLGLHTSGEISPVLSHSLAAHLSTMRLCNIMDLDLSTDADGKEMSAILAAMKGLQQLHMAEQHMKRCAHSRTLFANALTACSGSRRLHLECPYVSEAPCQAMQAAITTLSQLRHCVC